MDSATYRFIVSEAKGLNLKEFAAVSGEAVSVLHKQKESAVRRESQNLFISRWGLIRVIALWHFGCTVAAHVAFLATAEALSFGNVTVFSSSASPPRLLFSPRLAACSWPFVSHYSASSPSLHSFCSPSASIRVFFTLWMSYSQSVHEQSLFVWLGKGLKYVKKRVASETGWQKRLGFGRALSFIRVFLNCVFLIFVQSQSP